MTPRGRSFARNQAGDTRPAEASAPSAAEQRDNYRNIPLDLADLVAPYRKQGRISLRIERLPHRTRLSAGRNNGDRSWSLTPDELEGLNFLTPCDADNVRSLSVRIVSVDGAEGATIAVIDCPVGNEPDRRAQSRRAGDLAADQEARDLRSEVVRVKSLLTEREAELAAERAKPAGPDEKEIKALLATELSAQRENLERQRENDRSVARRESDALLEASRRVWAEEQGTRLAEVEARAEERLTREKKSWQQQSDAALAKAEKAWKSEEAARAAAAQANWREQSARLVADARQESAAFRQSRDEAELQKLRNALAAATSSLSERDTALTAAKQATVSEQERAKRELASSLAEAEKAWRKDEARRMSAVEADWRKRMEEREASARAELAAVREGGTRTHVLLEEELGKLRASLAERESALSELRRTGGESERRVNEFAALAITEAEKTWKEAEAHRLATAEKNWREQMAKAVSAAWAELGSVRGQQNAELSSAQAECAKLQDILSERDRELARLRAAPKEQKLSRTEWEAKLSEEKRAWKEGEASRLSAAEERWRADVEAQLTAASERTAKAEAEMAELRAQTEASNRAKEFELVRVRRDLEKTKVALASREVDLTLARSAHDKGREGWTDERHVTLHEPVHAWRERSADNENEKRTTGTLIRDIALVASFAAVATLFLPRLEELLPPGTLPFTFEEASAAPVKPMTGPPAHVVRPAPTPAPARPTDVVLRTTNMRSSPSKSATIVALLAPGVELTPIDKKGHWVLVETSARDTGNKLQQGWVYATYLKDGSADARGAVPHPLN